MSNALSLAFVHTNQKNYRPITIHKLPSAYFLKQFLYFYCMKTLLLCIIILIADHAQAQKNKPYQYYDWQWKPCQPGEARFASLNTKTDSGWYRQDYFLGNSKLQMQGLYADSADKIRNGSFQFYYANGMQESTGRYAANKKEGLWLQYHRNGMMSDSAVFENDERTGTTLGWHANGYMSDSVVYTKNAPEVIVNWFDNGNLSSAGRRQGNKLEGSWQYFHKNGNPAAKEVYLNGKLQSRIYFNEEGKAEADTTNKDRDANFKGGNKAWQKFILKHIYFPEQYKLVNTDIVTVVVSALIDEEGNVTEAIVEIPFKDQFDKIALEIFKKSPPWLPAISHNRNIKQWVRQPISFSQE